MKEDRLKMNQYDYGMRIYDPRIGRFLSVDPLTKPYPWFTAYQYAGNNPIRFLRELKEGEGGDYAVLSGTLNGESLAGKTIDQFGMPASALAKGAKFKDFISFIDSHFKKIIDKKVDFLLMDVRAFNKDQIKTIKDYIDKNYSKYKDKLFTIGSD
jgi:hypothetical protein